MTLALVTNATDGSIESADDLTPRKRWELEIEAAEKEVEKFHKRGGVATDRFLDERADLSSDMKWFNVYYANTNILESALYADIPEPSVARRYDDFRDQVARVAALILERSLRQDLDDPADEFDSVMRQCVQDRLIPGLGVAWLRLETEVESKIPDTEGGSLTNDAAATQPAASGESFAVPGQQMGPGYDNPQPEGQTIPLKKIKDQRVAVDYVHWRDFRWSPCRVWSERRWVARRVYMTREQLTKRFGKAKATLCALDHSTVKSESEVGNVTPLVSKDVFKKAVVWEIWDRMEREVHWYAPGYAKELLDTRDDFLHLQSFEPVPEPMFANISTSSTVPRPDYYMIQDQYTELNSVNARIALLIQACKVVGVYDQSAGALEKLFTGNENTMVPVPNWSQFSEKGGVKGSVDWIPLEMVVVALQKLYEARESIKGQIYELTGIADIVRGDSKASETLGAQKIKAQFASIRIKKLQNEVARFASDILRIKAEISVNHYTPETLIRRSGIVYTDNDLFVPDAIALLKSEEGFQWRVEVQADSMAQADYEAEKEDRTKFMSMVTGYMAQAMPIAGQVPELKPVIFGLLKWGIASFKGAQDIEGMIDRQLALLEGKPPPPPKPDPAEQANQAKLQAIQMKGQVDGQKAQADIQGKHADVQIAQQKGEAELTKMQQEMALRREEHQMEMQMAQEKLAMQAQEHRQTLQFQNEKAQQEAAAGQLDLQTTAAMNQADLRMHQQTAAMKVHDSMVQSDINKRKGEQALDQSADAHEQSMKQDADAAALAAKFDKGATK